MTIQVGEPGSPVGCPPQFPDYGGSVQERIAKRLFPNATLVQGQGADNHFAPVLEGKAYAVLVPTFAPQIILASAPDRLSLPLEKPVSSTFAAMGVRTGDRDFLNYLDTWLASQRDDGWLGDRASYWATTTDWMKWAAARPEVGRP